MSKFFLETIKCEDAKVFHLSYHQLRYESVLRSLNCSNFKDLKIFIIPPKRGLYRCRIVYSTDEISVEYIPYKKREIKKLKIVFDDKIEYSKKYANRENIDKLFQKKGEADDILIIKNQKVTDTSIANIAFFDGEQWLTPKNPLLKGTTRARLLDEKKIIEKDILLSEIKSFSKVALLNAMIDFDIIAEENIRDIYC